MNIASFVMFLIGILIGIFFRSILITIIRTKNKIREAEAIIENENKRKRFREKYDYSDSFNDKNEE